MSYDWLIIPLLLLMFGLGMYLLYRRDKKKDWHENTINRYYDAKHRAEDRSRDYG